MVTKALQRWRWRGLWCGRSARKSAAAARTEEEKWRRLVGKSEKATVAPVL